MPFNPNTEQHAIVEVVFGVQLARNLSAKELDALVAAHKEHFSDLPKVHRPQIIQFAFGEGSPPADLPIMQPTAGVMFDAMKRDGSLDWRLRADDNRLFVNCLSYTRWADVWPTARKFLAAAGDIVVGADNAVTGFILQYIDVFRWAGDPSTYNVDAMLDRNSTHLPGSIFDCGPLWHLHQGWYRNVTDEPKGRVLERVHLDAVLEEKQVPIVKVDTYIQLELSQKRSWAAIFTGESPIGDALFDKLHEQDKDILKSILTEDMARRVALID